MSKKKQPKSDGVLMWEALSKSVRAAAKIVGAVNNIAGAASSVKTLRGKTGET
jgi:hypothetical protein